MEPTDVVDPDPDDAAGPSRPERVRRTWRIGTPVVVLLSGALFAVSATNSEGTDLRPGRYTDLATLTQGASDDYEALQSQVQQLEDEVAGLTDSVDDAGVRREQRRAEKLRGPAGLEPVAGPGVTVVLSDAPSEALEEAVNNPDPDFALDRLVVHQQDIQAVVNALWAGGAGAVTIQGQRIVTTTGIQCSGSAVRLQGVPYPQPYTIQAVGDPALLASALAANEDVSSYRSDADRPEIGVGWDFEEAEEIDAPSYEGLIDISQAEPLG